MRLHATCFLCGGRGITLGRADEPTKTVRCLQSGQPKICPSLESPRLAGLAVGADRHPCLLELPRLAGLAVGRDRHSCLLEGGRRRRRGSRLNAGLLERQHEVQ